MQAPTATAEAMPASQGTGILIYGSTHEMESIDPAVGYTLWSRYIDDNVYDALFRFDGDPPELVNHLAKSYDVSDDGLEWTFYLEENVLFHDRTPLTASDVKYSMERMLAMQDVPSFLWSNVDASKLEIIDDLTVKIVLTESFGPFLYTLPWLYIVNEKLVKANEKDGDWGGEWMRDNDAGSGPFMISSFQADVRIEMPYFPDYWKGWPEKRLDGWVYEIHREPGTLKQLLSTGAVHLSDRLGEDDYDVVTGYDNVMVSQNPTLQPFMLKLNNQRPPTDNADFRRALTYALDYAAIVDGLFGGHVEYLDGPVPAGYPGRLSLTTPKQDMDKAREYLEKSGINPADVLLTCEFFAGEDIQRDMGLVLQNNLKELGIEMTVEGVTWPVLAESFLNPETNFHVCPVWASTDYPDAEILLYPQYRSHEPGTGSWYNCSWYNNPKYDEMVDRARNLPNAEDRIAVYQELQKMLVEDAVDIWIFTTQWRVAMLDCVKGYEFQKAGMQSTYFYPMSLDC